MQFIFEDEAPEDLYSDISKYLSECDAPFHPSKLYDSQKDSKFVDKNLRLSEFREIRDASFFDTVQGLVDVLNKNQNNRANNTSESGDDAPSLDFTLVKNDATHIRYQEGGFFKSHADFLSLTSNIVQEYTLLLCVTPEDKARENLGGETKIFIGGDKGTTETAEATSTTTHVSRATTTPGRFLVFRKDLDHEGSLLKKGEKHILALNLWCTSRASSAGSGGVLLVRFSKEDREKKQQKIENDEISNEQRLRDLSSQAISRTYAIPFHKLKDFPNSLLCDYFEIGADSQKNGVVVEFDCTHSTFESFSPIYKIIMGMYVPPDQVTASIDLINYYNIPVSSILMGFVSIEDALPLELEENGTNASEGTNKDDEETRTTAEVSDPLRLPGDDVKDEDYFFKGAGEDELLDSDDDDMSDIDFEGRVIGYKDIEKVSEMPLHLGIRQTDSTKQNNGINQDDGGNKEEENKKETETNDGIIVCATWHRTQVVADLARDLGMPYVPFRVVFVEGATVYGGGMIDTPARMITMRPVWASVGSYDNILFYEHLLHRHQFEEEDPKQMENFRFQEGFFRRPYYGYLRPNQETMLANLSEPNKRWENVIENEDYEREENGIVSIRLRCAYDLDSNEQTYTNNAGAAPLPESWKGIRYAIVKTILRGTERPYGTMVTLPDGNEIASSSTNNGDETATKPLSVSQLFHFNAEGKSCFTLDEAEDASDRLQSMDFLPRLQKKIHEINFELPQVRTADQGSFCNESVYVKLVWLEVTGVVELR